MDMVDYHYQSMKKIICNNHIINKIVILLKCKHQLESPVMFCRYLNVAQNKIEKLPPSGDRMSGISPTRRPKTGRSSVLPDRLGYTAPVLEEVYLQVGSLMIIIDVTIYIYGVIIHSLCHLIGGWLNIVE